jgi:hypothetical protein
MHAEKLAELKAMPKVPKYAKGGVISASDEKRPMPDDLYDDAMQAHQNEARKPLKNSDWTDNPTVKQAQDNNGRKVMPIARPKHVPTDAFSVRMYNKEGHLEDAMPPSSPKDQPESDYNEEGAKRQGPPVHKMKMMAKGGKVNEDMAPVTEMNPELHEAAKAEHAKMKKNKHGFEGNIELAKELKKNRKYNVYAEGGEINDFEPMHDAEEDGVQHPAGLESDNDEMRPDMHEYMSGEMAGQYADGGIAHEEDMQPEDEEHMEHHDSIAAAIMAKRDRLHAHIDSGAMDEDHAAEAMMADGGILDSAEDTLDPSVGLGKMAGIKLADGGILDSAEDTLDPSVGLGKMAGIKLAKGGEILKDSGKILSADSIYPSKSSQADLSRNHDEDANMEDQTSFNALRKENYSSSNLDIDQPEDSNEKGDEREANRSDKHDMIAKIRAKRSKRQFNWE